MIDSPLTLEVCDPESADARLLLEELSAALARLTGSSGTASFAPEDTRVERAVFVIARTGDGALSGCGALRPLDADVGELKRMYARPGSAGAGAVLLAHLEQQARAFGYRELWLETRHVNRRAVDFYLKHGYRQIAKFGKYVGRDEAICLGKTLGLPYGSAPVV